MSSLGQLLESLPDGVFAALEAASSAAFLAGPLAVIALGSDSWVRGAMPSRDWFPTAVLLSLLSVTVSAVTGTASLIREFLRIATTGHGGVGIVSDAGADAAQSMLYGVLALAACLLAVTALTFLPAGARRFKSAPHTTPMSAGVASTFVGLMALAIIGVEGLLRIHHDMMTLTTMMISADTRLDAASAEAIGQDSTLLIVGGALLSLVLMVLALAMSRAFRERSHHPVIVWASGVFVVLMLAGTIGHAGRVRTSLEVFREMRRAAGVATLLHPPATTIRSQETGLRQCRGCEVGLYKREQKSASTSVPLTMSLNSAAFSAS